MNDNIGLWVVAISVVIATMIWTGRFTARIAVRRGQRRAYLALPWRELGGLRGAAAHHVGAQVVRGRHPVHGAGEFALHQDDALVALLDLGKKALDYPGFAKSNGKHIEQRTEVH